MSEYDVEKETMMLGGKGIESFITRFKLKRRHLAVSAAAGLIGMSLIFVAWGLAVSPMTFSLVKNSFIQVTADESLEWVVQCRSNDWVNSQNFKCGDAKQPDKYFQTTVSLPGKDILLTKEEYSGFIEEVIIPQGYSFFEPDPLMLFRALLFGFAPVIFLICFTYAFRFFVSGGQEEVANKRIDGVQNLLTGNQLSEKVKESDAGDCGWTLADVALPNKSMVMGLAVSGAQGTGKSLVLHDMISQAKKKDVRLFVNDPAGEFWIAHGKPENGDVFFNPALLGGVSWSIFKELVYEYDSDVLAYAFLPKRESKGNGDFFDDAARSLFSAILRRLAELGAENSSEIARAFFDLEEDELAALVAGTAAADAVSSDAKGMRAGVMASAAIHMSGIAMMAPGSWNFRDFLDQPRGNIYFVGDDAKFRAVKRLMFATAFEIIKDRDVKHRDIKYLFVLDEYPILGDIDIDRHLAEKRKFGVGVFLGMQAETQLVTLMGEPRADTTMGVIGTTLQLRTPDAKAQKRAEAKFGAQNLRIVAESQTLAIAEAKDSLGINKTQQEKALIMAAKFGMLEDLTGYLSVIGGFPSAKVNYRHWFNSGTGRDSDSTRADEISTPIQLMPEKDPRFLLKRAEPGGKGWQQNIDIEVLQAQINNLKRHIPTLTQASAKEKKMELLKNLEAKLAVMTGGETVASDQKFGIDLVDHLDFDLDAEDLTIDDDGQLI